MKPKFLILSGDGINCERDCALAINEAGGIGEIVHINDLSVMSIDHMEQFQGAIFPGGFSFGDELGSGQVLALKFRHLLNDKLQYFVEKKLPILGICNGFQFLLKFGLLPNTEIGKDVSLVVNDHGQFIDRWVSMKVKSGPCLWLKGIEEIQLPIRHGEGRIYVKENALEEFNKMIDEGLAPLVYDRDINGSIHQIAGLCNSDGNIFGLMPHPEAAIFPQMNPDRRKWNDDQQILGLQLFKNAIEYLNK